MFQCFCAFCSGEHFCHVNVRTGREYGSDLITNHEDGCSCIDFKVWEKIGTSEYITHPQTSLNDLSLSWTMQTHERRIFL